MEMYIKR